MNWEQLGVLLKTFGFPAAVAGWALWRLDWFMSRIVESQDKIVVLLQRLIEMH